jgi:hypothetical protein
MTLLSGVVFGGRIISKDISPPPSPDLTSLGYYLWRTMEKLTLSSPHTLLELKKVMADFSKYIFSNEFPFVFPKKGRRIDGTSTWGLFGAFAVTKKYDKLILVNHQGLSEYNLIPGIATACLWAVESGKLMYPSTSGHVLTCVYISKRPN